MSQTAPAAARPGENRFPLVLVVILVIILIPGVTVDQRLMLLAGLSPVLAWAARP